jgi:hypothetical protein
MDAKLQEEYKTIASMIYSELQKIKIWEQEMLEHRKAEVTEQEMEGEGNFLRPVTIFKCKFEKKNAF